jgi:hypothetical protein
MISMTPTWAPADLLGQGGLDARAASGSRLCPGSVGNHAPRMAAPFAPVRGTGLPAAGIAVRLRPVTGRPLGRAVVARAYDGTTFENNVTTLGNHSSGRPQS